VPQGVPSPDAAAPVVPRLDLPQGWHECLAQDQVFPTRLLEAVLHMVRIELQLHRDRWITAEQSLRAAMQLGSDGAIQAALGPLRTELEAWVGWLQPFLAALKGLRERLGEHVACADRIEESLLDQASRIEALQEQQNEVAQSSDKELALRKYLREYATIFEMAHALRDYVLDQLAIAAHGAGRLGDMPAAWLRDSVSGYPNRLGLELLTEELLRQEPARKQLITGAFIEIDRLGKLNERLGVQQSDQVIKAFAKLVEGVVRSDRGDQVARVAGPTMFVLLSDAGVAGAKAAAERIRQTVEAATFQTRREEFTLAANCAVCDLQPDDTMAALLARLKAGIAEAKRGGRNRTAVDEGQGPVLFDAQPIQVRAQTIQVG
jgi:diguanylate cyclase (GGDEF)-like protein